MYRTIADFIADFERENGATAKLLGTLTDESLAQPVCAGGRTLGRLAWHIVGTLHEMPAHAGLVSDAGEAERPVPRRADDIAAAYDRAAAAVRQAVASGWADDDLGTDIELYGETWTRGRVLAALILHEVHHRGQMTVLMRQAGLPVTGVYGPSREEWAVLGMPEQE